jgi:hypothetical protein
MAGVEQCTGEKRTNIVGRGFLRLPPRVECLQVRAGHTEYRLRFAVEDVVVPVARWYKVAYLQMPKAKFESLFAPW